MGDFREYLNESKNIKSAVEEMYNDLFQKSIGKSTDMDNYWNELLKKNGLKDSDKTEIIKLIQKKGYTGDLI